MGSEDFWLALEANSPNGEDHSSAAVHEVTLPSVRALDAQFGVWPKKHLPEEISSNLFGENFFSSKEILHAEQSTHTFAILDAAKIPDLPDTLANSGLTYLNLFRGTAAQELADVSPYIVKLEIENDFVRKLFTDTGKKTDLWSNEVGIYVRSKDTIENLLRLFRKFTRVRDEHDNWSYFRFWEPDVAEVHFSYLSRRADLATGWFYTDNENPVGYVIVRRDGRAAKYIPNRPFAGISSSNFRMEVEEKEALKVRRVQASFLKIQSRLATLLPGKTEFEIRDALNRVAERFSQDGFVNTGSIFALCWYELTQGPHFERKLKVSALKDLEQKQVAEDLRILKLQSALGQ